MKRCCFCFKEYSDKFDICSFCGERNATEPLEPIHLYPGTMLAERYIIGLAVGSGGFGIIYQAWDSKLETVVAVKEYYASRLVTRATGIKDVIINKKSASEFEYRKARFLAEARNMAKFGAHKNIPNVFEFFEENHTAYIVMELLEGIALNGYMYQNNEKVDKDFAIFVANEVGKALISLHEQGIIHRDVAPDNIFLCSEKGLRIKLLDLGAAKLADSTDEVIDIILKPGYSPVEQYDNSKNIGPWTDVYALGATIYFLLTGIKPDESTNRKISDAVVPLNELDESIPENLSNSIMKAMAVEKHMRFKTVVDFLKAINGEKKVVTIAKERKMRKRRRFTGIIAACLTLAIISGSVMHTYSSKKSEQVLSDASISIWFSVADGSSEQEAMETIISEFKSKFNNVVIELKAIPEEEFFLEIEKAASGNFLPTLFESTDISSEILADTVDIKNVLQSDQVDDCLFLDQYEEYYKDYKQIPLGIEIPMAYVVTNGNTFINYQENYFSDLSDFGDKTSVAVDSSHGSLIGANLDTAGLLPESEFLNNEENTCAVMLSSSMALNEVRETLTNYEKTYVFYDSNQIVSRFTYEWSIGSGSKNEVKAAERLLSWMLGNSYQNTLMISKCNDGQIPVNSTCFKEKISQKNLTGVEKVYKKFIFRN